MCEVGLDGFGAKLRRYSLNVLLRRDALELSMKVDIF